MTSDGRHRFMIMRSENAVHHPRGLLVARLGVDVGGSRDPKRQRTTNRAGRAGELRRRRRTWVPALRR